MTIQPPSTQVVTNHGLFISVNGKVVGAINTWEPDESQGVQAVWEFGGVTTGQNDVPAERGEAFENVPGNITGTTIGITRYDIYASRFESAFGTRDLIMLSRQTEPIQFREFIQAPDGTFAEQNVYYGVWFNKRGRRHDAKGDRIVMVNASATYTRKRRIS